MTRPGSAWFFTGMVLVLATLVAWGALLERSGRTPALLLTAATAAYVGWVLFWRPVLRVTEEEITVVNPWRTDHVPWSGLVDIDTRFHLTLVTRDRRVQVVAAPSPGGLRSLRATGGRESLAMTGARPGQRAGDHVSTHSGGAAAVIRGHWQELVEVGSLGDEEPVRGQRDHVVIAVAVAGAAASLLAWLARLL